MSGHFHALCDCNKPFLGNGVLSRFSNDFVLPVIGVKLFEGGALSSCTVATFFPLLLLDQCVDVVIRPLAVTGLTFIQLVLIVRRGVRMLSRAFCCLHVFQRRGVICHFLQRGSLGATTL